MSTPLVSCIIGTYNREKYLRASLDSIFAQSYTNLEVVAVDDASTDGTVEILESYGDKIRIIRRTTNSRTCELARYQGTAAAKGVYCAFLDSDDLWKPNKIARQVAFFEARPDVPLCHTYFMVIDDDGEEQHVRHEGTIPETGRCARELLERCFVSVSSVMVKKDVWLAAKREEDITDFGMDVDFFLQIAREHPLGFIPEVLGCYRRSALSVGQHKWKRNPRNVTSLERMLREKMYEGVASRSEMRRILVDAYLENAEAHRHQGYAGHALYFAFRGLRHRPYDPRAYAALAKALVRISGLSPAPSRPSPITDHQ